MTPAETATYKAIFGAYLAILVTLDTSTRRGLRAWARIALQARRELLKAGLADLAGRYVADAIYAWKRSREVAKVNPFDAGKFRVVMLGAGVASRTVERCLDAARGETCPEVAGFRGERGAA